VPATPRAGIPWQGEYLWLFWKGKPMGDGSGFEHRRAISLGGPTPPPSAIIFWRASPMGAGSRLERGRLGLRVVEVQILRPPPFWKVKPTGDGRGPEHRRARSARLGGPTPSPSAMYGEPRRSATAAGC